VLSDDVLSALAAEELNELLSSTPKEALAVALTSEDALAVAVASIAELGVEGSDVVMADSVVESEVAESTKLLLAEDTDALELTSTEVLAIDEEADESTLLDVVLATVESIEFDADDELATGVEVM
jgi:hypothetical protein